MFVRCNEKLQLAIMTRTAFMKLEFILENSSDFDGTISNR
jgi:hypothetical protein